MDKQTLREELDATFACLHSLFTAVPENAINTVPFPGSWTPGQLLRHLEMANGGCLETLRGPVQDTARPFDTAVENIRNSFLDFSTKFESPDFVVPPAIHYDKEDLLGSVRSIRSGLLTALDTHDLTQTCLLFEFPAIGYLTRWEVLHFVLYHTQRHTEQLRKMKVHLEELEPGSEKKQGFL
jgi:hypothetical protein